ncbi:MAG TPA: AzlC family ABC transporter permease [Acidimicrobiia bacterium]|nr:AzlC family ABC transporter permease [Acidimicrobiia bacterium]
MSESSYRRGFRDTLPLIPPLIVFGLVYGALASQVGFSPLVTGLSSLLIVSGSAQLAMVGLIPFGVGPVLVATTGLALRHIPMAIHLSDLIGPVSPWQRFHLSWILVDESYGLTVTAAEKGVPDLAAYKTAADFTLYASWVVTTVIGAIVGAQLDPARYGLDAVIPLVFLGLAAAIIRGWRRWLSAALAVGTTFLAVAFLPSAWQLTSAAFLAAVLAAAVPGPAE